MQGCYVHLWSLSQALLHVLACCLLTTHMNFQVTSEWYCTCKLDATWLASTQTLNFVYAYVCVCVCVCWGGGWHIHWLVSHVIWVVFESHSTSLNLHSHHFVLSWLTISLSMRRKTRGDKGSMACMIFVGWCAVKPPITDPLRPLYNGWNMCPQLALP